MKALKFFISKTLTIALLVTFSSCQKESTPKEKLNESLLSQIKEIEGDVAVAFLNLSAPNDSLLINATEEFHAASTMKVPVMIELYKQQRAGKCDLQDSIVLVNQFESIVDGSPYSMDISDDSDDIIYNKIGTKMALFDLMYPMITVSSNLATNILIEIVDAKNVTQTMRDLGAKDIKVLRGVEDQKAYDMGLSNSTTAKDLMIIINAIATNQAGAPEDSEKMIEVLKDQKFNEIIPKHLPKDVEVAHKTGSITGLHHDAGIVYLPDGRSYVLVLLSKNLKDFNKGTAQLADLSKTVYDYMVEN